MLSIRCFKCGWAWSMTPAEVAAALDLMYTEHHTDYYMAECPKCRRVNKIPIKRLRRSAPRDWKPTPIEKPATITAEKQSADKPKPAAADEGAAKTKTDKPKAKPASKGKSSK